MRACIAVFLLLASVYSGVSATVKIARIHVGGKEFVSVSDWARANNFDARWVKKDDLLRVSNKWHRMDFTTQSSEAEINGIKIYLSLPVVLRNGAVYLSQIDMRAVVHPIVYPPKNASGKKVKTICIDPGHGGNDVGTRSGSYQEKKYTLLFAQELRDQLTRAGFKVSLTRTGDTTLDRSVRTDIARKRASDLFVSLHYNGAGAKSSAKGVEVYCLTPVGASSTNAGGEGSGAGRMPGNRFDEKNMQLAYQIHRAMTSNLPAEDRGLRRARFEVLRLAEMPAVLIEGGFISNPSELKKIVDPNYRKQMVQSIVRGIVAYKNQVER